MKIRLLVGHYRENYAGELAPNVFAAVDEFIEEENPRYWPEEVAKQKKQCGDEINRWAEVVIDMPMGALMDALYPDAKITESAVVGATPAVTAQGHDPRIKVGALVAEVDADDDAIADGSAYGVVDSIQDGGYAVIWNVGDTPTLAALDDVRFVDEAEARAGWASR